MSCYGCNENLANQMAHMEVGGCLEVQSQASYSEEVEEPIGCCVCIVQDHLSGRMDVVRRASPGALRCRDHIGQCAYCRSECVDNLLCDRCSYSGAAMAIAEAFIEEPTLCLYDGDVSPSEGWTCGCSRCIQATAIFYACQDSESDHESEGV